MGFLFHGVHRFVLEYANKNEIRFRNVVRQKKKNSMVSDREQSKQTKRPPLVNEVIANFCG
jgi:hypothetical protein